MKFVNYRIIEGDEVDKKYVFDFIPETDKVDKARKWCDQTFEEDEFQFGTFHVDFHNEADALAFKLVWWT